MRTTKAFKLLDDVPCSHTRPELGGEGCFAGDSLCRVQKMLHKECEGQKDTGSAVMSGMNNELRTTHRGLSWKERGEGLRSRLDPNHLQCPAGVNPKSS